MTTPPYLRRVSPAASCFGCAGGEAPTLDDNDVAPLLDVETGGGDRRGRPSAEEMRTGKQPRREPTTTDAEMMHEWNRAGVMAIKCVVRKTRCLGDLLNSSAGPKLAFGCASMPVDLIL
uniref:Uncharacterized protein n=1 Tax=Oryza sativa subsp. japonica TaxID=39947 RepID=Q6ZFY7_ORYSJ|nr:hypothetical protein [Oryza sativa Japonica Group]BAD07768.1 hypothetical protein [Oryza sativa Japonica Group]